MTHDTISTTSLLDLDDEKAADRATLLLLKRAEQEGAEGNRHALDNPFFRLHPEERFILTALHRGHWSYQRIAHILGEDNRKVEELAWAARVHLASLSNLSGTDKKIAHPLGGSLSGVRCPDYDSRRPLDSAFYG